MSKERRLFKGGEMSMKRKWTLLFMTMAIMLCIMGCSSVPKEKLLKLVLLPLIYLAKGKK